MTEKADKSKIFDMLLSCLKETRTSFFTDFISVFAQLLTSLGLILTFEKVKPIIEIGIIYYCSVATLLLFNIFYSKHLLTIKKKSSVIASQLDDLEYMDGKYFRHYEISKAEFIPMLFSVFVIFLVLIIALSWLKFS